MNRFALTLALAFSALLAGCGDSAPISTAKMDADGFTDKVATAFFCYTYASSTKQSATEIKRHADDMMRMQARRFCPSAMVEYYTCYSVRNLLTGSGAGCPKPTQALSDEEVLRCANSVAASLDHARKKMMKMMSGQGFQKEQIAVTFKTHCQSGNATGGGLKSY